MRIAAARVLFADAPRTLSIRASVFLTLTLPSALPSSLRISRKRPGKKNSLKIPFLTCFLVHRGRQLNSRAFS